MALIYMRINFETTSQNENCTLNMSVPVFMERNLGFEFRSVLIYNYEADFCSNLECLQITNTSRMRTPCLYFVTQPQTTQCNQVSLNQIDTLLRAAL